MDRILCRGPGSVGSGNPIVLTSSHHRRSSRTTVAKQVRPTAVLLSTFDSDGSDFRCEIAQFGAQKTPQVHICNHYHRRDRTNTRLNYSHQIISYATLCLQIKHNI